MGLTFDWNGVASIVNGLITNMLSATLIFLFIWLFRKRPQIRIEAKVLAGAMPPFRAIQGEDASMGREYPIDLEFTVYNQSIFNAYSFSVYKIKYPHEKLLDLQKLKIKEIVANAVKSTTLRFKLFKHHLSLTDLQNAEGYILPEVKTKLILKVKYFNEDHRPFRKTIDIDL